MLNIPLGEKLLMRNPVSLCTRELNRALQLSEVLQSVAGISETMQL
jgi:hypothetical protein